METTRPQSRKSLWVSGGWYLLAALPVGLGILTGVLSILAAMMLFADAPEWMLRLMAGIALVFSGYGMGRFAGFRRRRKGWRCGLFCGLFLWAVLTLASLVWLHTAGSPVRLLCLCGGGVWGGISGVNAPHRKPLDSRKVLLQDVNFFPILHGTLENPVIL